MKPKCFPISWFLCSDGALVTDHQPLKCWLTSGFKCLTSMITAWARKNGRNSLKIGHRKKRKKLKMRLWFRLKNWLLAMKTYTKVMMKTMSLLILKAWMIVTKLQMILNKKILMVLSEVDTFLIEILTELTRVKVTLNSFSINQRHLKSNLLTPVN